MHPLKNNLGLLDRKHLFTPIFVSLFNKKKKKIHLNTFAKLPWVTNRNSFAVDYLYTSFSFFSQAKMLCYVLFWLIKLLLKSKFLSLERDPGSVKDGYPTNTKRYIFYADTTFIWIKMVCQEKTVSWWLVTSEIFAGKLHFLRSLHEVGLKS